jgi:hypothetical protein
LQVAFLVHYLSSSYNSISRDHLMPLVAKLGTLIAYDGDKDKDRIADEKMKLTHDCQEIQEIIADTLRSNNEAFHQKVAQRMEAIGTTFKTLVPSLPPQEEKHVKALVQEAVRKGVSNQPIEEIDLSEF